MSRCTTAVFLLFLAALPCLIRAMEESVYMKRSEIDDQTSSETGYSYQSGTPFVQPYAPLQLGHYQELQQLPHPIYPPVNSYGLHAYPVAYGLNNIVQPQQHQINIPAPVQQPPLPVLPLQPPPIPLKPIGGGESEDGSSSFSKGGGSSYSAADQAAKGEKGESAYKSQESQEKSLEGKHQKEGQKGHYNEESAKKSGQHSEGNQYGQKEAEAKGNHGAHFQHAQSHKKGSKTKGFRHYHHKDEYKKDHEFWDESDTSGHFNKYGNEKSQHAEQKGAFEKGGHQAGAFEAKDHSAKGFQDKGAHSDQDSAFKAEEGKQSHFKDFQEYGKKGGEQESQAQGFSQEEGGKLLKQL